MGLRKMVQIHVEQWVSPTSTRSTTTWVDVTDKPIREGDRISFKEDDLDGWWIVKAIYADGAGVQPSDLHTDWNVGGLTGTH